MLCIIIENILLNYHCHSCLCYGELHIFTSILICCFSSLFSHILSIDYFFLTFFAVSVSCVWLHIHRTCRSWSASLVAIFFTREFDLSVYVIARCNLRSVWFASLTIFAERRRFILELKIMMMWLVKLRLSYRRFSRGKNRILGNFVYFSVRRWSDCLVWTKVIHNECNKFLSMPQTMFYFSIHVC